MAETNMRDTAVGFRPSTIAKAPVMNEGIAAAPDAAAADAPAAPEAPLDLQLRGDPAAVERRSLVAVGGRGPLRTPALPARTGDPGAVYRSLDDSAFVTPVQAAVGRALDGAAITADQRAGGTAEGIAKHGANGPLTGAARAHVVNGARTALLGGAPAERERPEGTGASVSVRGVSARAEGNGCTADANVSTRGAVAVVSCASGTGAALHAELTSDRNGSRLGVGVKIPIGK